jgi:predicted transcriptional regulator
MAGTSERIVTAPVDAAGLTLDDVRRILEAEVIVEGRPETVVRAVGAADLLSDVLALGTPGMLLLTGLATPQTIRTAEVVELAGIVFVRGRRVDDGIAELARRAGLSVMRTHLSLFEASGRLYVAILERRGERRRGP